MATLELDSTIHVFLVLLYRYIVFLFFKKGVYMYIIVHEPKRKRACM